MHAIAVAMKQSLTKEFVDYQHQVVKNAQTMANYLQEKGYTIATGGTENHLCLLDLRPLGMDGARVEFVLELMAIACNKNTAPGDKSAFTPGGIRLGSPALTSRNFKEADFKKVVDFIHEGVQFALRIQPKAGKTVKDFKNYCSTADECKVFFAKWRAEKWILLKAFCLQAKTSSNTSIQRKQLENCCKFMNQIDCYSNAKQQFNFVHNSVQSRVLRIESADTSYDAFTCTELSLVKSEG
uniref:Serine hydroxymethyltransferase-like domain-containing protein n=1 Tax=Romanomermis culicivorax TaxID=13658 RepID=A0A915KRM5_ROMCU